MNTLNHRAAINRLCFEPTKVRLDQIMIQNGLNTSIDMTRQERIATSQEPLPVFPDHRPKTPSNKAPHDPELGEYDLRIVAALEGHRGGKRAMDPIKAMIIIPMALHPTYHEEAMVQLQCFLSEHFLRTAQIALNAFLDAHSLSPATPDGKLAVDMEVRLPSVEKAPAAISSAPMFMIKPAAPDGEVR
jgi:hypothetical protein